VGTRGKEMPPRDVLPEFVECVHGKYANKCSMQNAECKMNNAEALSVIFHFALNILHFAFSSLSKRRTYLFNTSSRFIN
jgi:hypothetical protein